MMQHVWQKVIRYVRRLWRLAAAYSWAVALVGCVVVVLIGVLVALVLARTDHSNKESPGRSTGRQGTALSASNGDVAVSGRSGASSSTGSSTSQPAAGGSGAGSSVPSPTMQPAPRLPATVLNLSNWRLTLPVNTTHAGNPDEIDQPELAGFNAPPYFMLNDAKDGVIFQANAGGATTSGSHYPRSELREMTANGSQEASWSSTSGTHTMEVREAITHLPAVKPEVVATQIHDASDDVVMIKLSGNQLFVEADSKRIGDLDTNYQLGTVYTVKMVATHGHIYVYFNGTLKVDYAKSGSGYYFKAGCYTQSNTSKGDTPDAYAQVVIYTLQVAHS